MKRLAITGGRGRLAGGLGKFLEECGWVVEMFSREGGGGFREVIELTEPKHLGSFEAVLHLGWSSVPLVAEENPGIEEREDLPLARKLVEAAHACSTSPLLVFFSTAAVYGNTGDIPVREDAPCRPLGRYATAKLKVEEAFLHAPSVCVLRITNVFSPGCAKTRPQGIIPILLESARTGKEITIWGDGSAVKDYIAATDLYPAAHAVLEGGLTGVFNVGSGRSYSINQLIALVERTSGRRVSVRHTEHFSWDVERSFVSSEKLRGIVGWRAEVGIEGAIEELVGGGESGIGILPMGCEEHRLEADATLGSERAGRPFPLFFLGKAFLAVGRGVLNFPARLRRWAEWGGIGRAEGEKLVLGFGGMLDEGRFVHGGAVKLLALREGFAWDEKRFNILYLVSSAQPEFAEDLVAVCRRKGIRFVWNQNGVGYPGWAGMDAERHNAPMRRLRAQADFVIYQSAFCRDSAEKFLGSCDRSSAVLFNPVDLEKFCPAEVPVPIAPLRLLAMGTQNYRERVVVVLDCMQILRAGGVECVLTIAGPLLWKNAESDLHSAIMERNLGDVVVVRPRFDQGDAPGIYQAHHILLHPKYKDPCPTVVAEALACGLPVVASHSGGIPEMVDNSCARLLCVPQSWNEIHTPSGSEIAQAVMEIAPHVASYAGAARRRAEQVFDVHPWRREHAEVFAQVLASA